MAFKEEKALEAFILEDVDFLCARLNMWTALLDIFSDTEYLDFVDDQADAVIAWGDFVGTAFAGF